jgi:hypothetical protein
MKETASTESAESVDWGALGKALVAHAILRARRYPRLRGNLWPAGEGPEDVVSHLIIKYLTGARRRDPAKYPDLLIYLKLQLNSMLDHLARSRPARREACFPTGEDGQQHSDRIELEAQRNPAWAVPTPESEIEEREIELEARRRIDSLLRGTRDQPELRAVVQAILGGCVPRPRFLAARLGLEVKEINNRLKRLRRFAD